MLHVRRRRAASALLPLHWYLLLSHWHLLLSHWQCALPQLGLDCCCRLPGALRRNVLRLLIRGQACMLWAVLVAGEILPGELMV